MQSTKFPTAVCVSGPAAKIIPSRTGSETYQIQTTSSASESTDKRCQHPVQQEESGYTEQIPHLSHIVAEQTALKPKQQENINEGSHGSLLTELLSDSLSDINTICPDSSENCSTVSADPLPGLQSPSAVITPPVLLKEMPCSNSSPVTLPSRAPLTLIQQNSQLNNTSHGPTERSKGSLDRFHGIGNVPYCFGMY